MTSNERMDRTNEKWKMENEPTSTGRLPLLRARGSIDDIDQGAHRDSRGAL